MSLNVVTTLLLTFACFHLTHLVAGEDELGEPRACLEKLSVEDNAKRMAVIETCKKKLNLDKIPSMDEIEKNGFDDKCFAKCKLIEWKAISDKGEVDGNILEEFLNKVDPAKKADIMKLSLECAASTIKGLEGEGGINEKNLCKAAAMLKSCFMKGVVKFC